MEVFHKMFKAHYTTIVIKFLFWKPKMLVCTLGGEGGGGQKKCIVCTLMKMLTFLDGPLVECTMYRPRIIEGTSNMYM